MSIRAKLLAVLEAERPNLKESTPLCGAELGTWRLKAASPKNLLTPIFSRSHQPFHPNANTHHHHAPISIVPRLPSSS